jgi:hypothetical protein
MAERGSGLAGGPARIVVAGPLAPFAAGLRTQLTGQGFTRHAVAAHTHMLAYLSGWLAENELAAVARRNRTGMERVGPSCS